MEKKKNIKKFFPLFFLILFMVVGYLTGFYKGLNFEIIRNHHVEMIEYTNDHPLMSPLMFIATCAAASALSIPGGIILGVLGGFLFRQPWGLLYVILGTIIGSALLFLSLKWSFGELIRKKSGKNFKKIENEFNENAVNYLLFMRFIPFFPFWFVNILPALLNVRLRTFIWTTLVGITPKVFLFVQTGKGFNIIFESQKKFNFSSIFTFEMKLILIFLGMISLIPLIRDCEKIS